MIRKINYLLYRFFWKHAEKANLKTPLCLDLELSSACNLRCPFCYHSNRQFKVGFMSLPMASRALFEAHQLGVPSIKLNYRGEPTLNPHFGKICMLAKSLSSSSTFIDRITNTNMYFATDNESIFEGLLSQNRVKISLDSLSKYTYSKMRIGSDFDTVIKNITKLYNHPNRTKDHKIILQFVKTNINKDEDFAEAKKIWPRINISVRDEITNRVDTSRDTCSRGHHRQPCKQAFARIMITHEGNMFPCCPNFNEHSNLLLGNFNDLSIKEAFNSDKIKLIRKKLLDKSMFYSDPCKNCSSYESYENYKVGWHA